MFSLLSGLYDWYFSIPTYRILIIGEEKSGKTVNYIIIVISINLYFSLLRLTYILSYNL